MERGRVIPTLSSSSRSFGALYTMGMCSSQSLGLSMPACLRNSIALRQPESWMPLRSGVWDMWRTGSICHGFSQ